MKLKEKLSQLKNTIEEIKNISEKLGNHNVFETDVDELNKEVLRLKKGIIESIDELDKILEEENAKS